LKPIIGKPKVKPARGEGSRDVGRTKAGLESAEGRVLVVGNRKKKAPRNLDRSE
jgi:hypothetical protein